MSQKNNLLEISMFMLLALSVSLINFSHKLTFCSLMVVISVLAASYITQKQNPIISLSSAAFIILVNFIIGSFIVPVSLMIVMSYIAIFTSLSAAIMLISIKGFNITRAAFSALIVDTLLMSLGLFGQLPINKIIAISVEDILYKSYYLLTIQLAIKLASNLLHKTKVTL